MRPWTLETLGNGNVPAIRRRLRRRGWAGVGRVELQQMFQGLWAMAVSSSRACMQVCVGEARTVYTHMAHCPSAQLVVRYCNLQPGCCTRQNSVQCWLSVLSVGGYCQRVAGPAGYAQATLLVQPLPACVAWGTLHSLPGWRMLLCVYAAGAHSSMHGS